MFHSVVPECKNRSVPAFGIATSQTGRNGDKVPKPLQQRRHASLSAQNKKALDETTSEQKKAETNRKRQRA
jgi:hypothetical protein